MKSVKIIRSLFLLFSLQTLQVSGQESNESFYAFNQDWAQVASIDECTYFLHKVIENDSTYICRVYRKEGPMMSWQTYCDASLKIRNGIFAWYNEKGDLDSLGHFVKGKKDGQWKYAFDSKQRAGIIEEYSGGIFYRRIDYTSGKIKLANGEEQPIPDSLQRVDLEVKEKNVKDTIHHKPPEFPGGINGWVKYLNNYIRTPNRFMLISGPGTSASILVDFEVSTIGTISDIVLLHSREWSADMEVIRIIKSSPAWRPATIDGVKVKYRHQQSITFQVNR